MEAVFWISCILSVDTRSEFVVDVAEVVSVLFMSRLDEDTGSFAGVLELEGLFLGEGGIGFADVLVGGEVGCPVFGIPPLSSSDSPNETTALSPGVMCAGRAVTFVSNGGKE